MDFPLVNESKANFDLRNAAFGCGIHDSDYFAVPLTPTMDGKNDWEISIQNYKIIILVNAEN